MDEKETPKDGLRRSGLHPDVTAQQLKDILHLLLLFRFVNALCVRTFFQPDEYFQALEPAWAMVYGRDSGAWLTWEWQHQLRSSLHPAVFALVYLVGDVVMTACQFFPPAKAFFLTLLPTVAQSVFAGLGDWYTWRLATKVYGEQSSISWAALCMVVLNPWQWYCSTRTFSNSLETTLTIAGLYYWPWELVADQKEAKAGGLFAMSDRRNSLRLSLVLAATAVVLRPTNIFVWLGVFLVSVTGMTLDGKAPLQVQTLMVLIREAVVCASFVLLLSAISDRLYFGFWTFPPYKWLYFNLSQSLAVFYGRMPWHYYYSQGIPLLTTTYLPFALAGLFRPPDGLRSVQQANTLKTLAFVVFSVVATLSAVSHKEVRFIYPLLPMLHVLAAPSFLACFPERATAPVRHARGRRGLMTALFGINILLAGYLSLFHQAAPLAAVKFLRLQFERLHPDAVDFGVFPSSTSGTDQMTELFALFLMPCHSTPWRSHLVYPALRARALTCEPPLHTAPGSAERAAYLDEADRFYAPEADGGFGARFLREELWPASSTTGRGEHDMPRYVVGFEGVEPVLEAFFAERDGAWPSAKLRRVWDARNGLFSDDWRRSGRLVVWDTGVYPDGADGLP